MKFNPISVRVSAGEVESIKYLLYRIWSFYAVFMRSKEELTFKMCYQLLRVFLKCTKIVVIHMSLSCRPNSLDLTRDLTCLDISLAPNRGHCCYNHFPLKLEIWVKHSYMYKYKIMKVYKPSNSNLRLHQCKIPRRYWSYFNQSCIYLWKIMYALNFQFQKYCRCGHCKRYFTSLMKIIWIWMTA